MDNEEGAADWKNMLIAATLQQQSTTMVHNIGNDCLFNNNNNNNNNNNKNINNSDIDSGVTIDSCFPIDNCFSNNSPESPNYQCQSWPNMDEMYQMNCYDQHQINNYEHHNNIWNSFNDNNQQFQQFYFQQFINSNDSIKTTDDLTKHKPNAGKLRVTHERKIRRNARERERQNRLNDAFAVLKGSLPDYLAPSKKRGKLTQMETLTLANFYINFLQEQLGEESGTSRKDSFVVKSEKSDSEQ